MKKRILAMACALAAFNAFAANYAINLANDAEAMAAEAPILRKAVKPLANGVQPPAAVAVGDTIDLTLFDDISFSLKIVSAPPAGIAGQSFIARDEACGASAIVKVTKNGARISIDDFMNRRQFTVRCKDGTATITERDNSQESPDECGTCGGTIDVQPTTTPEAPAATTAAKSRKTLLGSSGNAFPVAEQKSVVDILVAFDQGAKAWAEKSSNWGNGGDTIEEFADYAVNKMNMVLEKSQLLDTFSYRLAGVVAIDDTYNKIDQTLLINLRTRAGALSKLSQLREKYGADTITLLINRSQGTTTGVGFGYYPVSSFPDPGSFDSGNYACNICDINTVYSRYTMSHETGHNMGCDHSTRQGPTNSGPGRFADSSGYHFVDANGVRRYTIMGYNYTHDDNYEYFPVPYFSSPDIVPDEYGRPVGVVDLNNNRRTLLNTCADIAGLREHVLPYDWDVRFLDDDGNDIADGAYFDGWTYVTLSHSNPNAEIYYTLDGSTPNGNSYHGASGVKVYAYLVNGAKTITACAVVDGVAQSIRSITLHDGLTWSGDENGSGLWLNNDSSVCPWNGNNYFAGDAVQFPELEKGLSPAVTVKGSVSPGSAAFTAIGTKYTFNKGDDEAKIVLPDANFAPAGDLTFNVPVQLNATTFTNMTGCALTFNAPFGQTLDANSGFCTNLVTILPYGKMTVAPGAGKTQMFDTLNNKYFAGTATFRVGEGTVMFNGAINGSAGVIGRTKLEVGNGGNLVFNMGGGTGYEMNNTSLTVEEGGSVTFNDMEHLRRELNLRGGTIYAKRFDLMSNPGVYATDDSSIENNGGGYILIRNSDAEINVAEDTTLTLNVGTQTDNRTDTSGWGIIKRGEGTIAANVELKHSGVTDIEEGTLEVGYTSGATAYGQGWIVAPDATLRIKSGCSLKVPALTLDPGSKISLPAAASAPLAADSLDLSDVKISLHDVGDLSQGATYPLIAATGDISGIKSLVRDEWPKPAKGLGWKVMIENGTLTATIVDAANSDPTLDFITNDSAILPSLPDDASMTEDGEFKLASSPVVIDGLDTKTIAVTLDVTLDEPTATERTLCSWKIGSNIVRCVVTNGVIDCFHGDNLHIANAVPFVKLSPGRHVINVGYKSFDNNTYGGTFVYADGVLAYRGAGLRWSNENVTRITVGASAADTPAYPYDGLVVNSLAALVPGDDATAPLPNMTDSCEEEGFIGLGEFDVIEYSYFEATAPSVFALTPNGAFTTRSSLVSAEYMDEYYELAVSIVASFPATATGTILSAAVHDDGTSYSTQVEYMGNGVFAFRDNGNNGLKTSVQTEIDVTKPHIYTMTYESGEGFALYIDGEEVLTNDDYFTAKLLAAWDRVLFGCGYWNQWMTSYNDNPNPMQDLTVYASHIALGTSDHSVSEAAVRASLADDEETEEPDEPDEPDTPDDPEPPETPATVDVLVAYDLGAQMYVANKNETLEAFAARQIGLMNDVLATNKLERFYTYRLAGVCKVDGTYTNIDTAPALAASGVDAMVSLRAEREIYGADTVTLLVDTTGNTLGNSSPLSSPNDVASQHECAFSVCSIRAVDTGKQHTMIHENAHNMGCGHARAQSIINSPFDYGRGYYFNDNDVTRHTIMAYGGDNDASWYFSTTSKEFGFTLGDATNNNSRVLKETCGEVAKWRDSVKPNSDELIVTDENGNEITSHCFFKDNIRVTVTAPVEAATLYYTFDGTDPTLSNYLFSQTSPFTFNFTGDRTLKIAYYDGNKMSPVRTVNVKKCASVPADGLWQTSKKYPWFVERDAIRSCNQTDYTYQCTTPLKATVAGPAKLKFKHKSYFGGESVAGNNYSHFDVLLDDSPVLAQTECTNSWTDAVVEIPDGSHEVTFVFSQRFAMNNPTDYKDGTPEANDAVWLKDIAIEVKPPEDERFDIPGCDDAYIDAASAMAWLENSDTYTDYLELNDGATWQEFMGETAPNGYKNWTNYILGYSADESSKKFTATIEIKDGEVVITTTEGGIPSGLNIVKRLFKKASLDADWDPPEGEVMPEKSATMDAPAGGGFYKVTIDIEL